MNKLDGSRIKKLWYGENGSILRESKDNIILEIKNEFHGDHDLDWVIVVQNGIEIERINVRFIESIVWDNSNSIEDIKK